MAAAAAMMAIKAKRNEMAAMAELRQQNNSFRMTTEQRDKFMAGLRRNNLAFIANVSEGE